MEGAKREESSNTFNTLHGTMRALLALTRMYLDISVNYLVIMKVLQSFKNLLGVEDDGGLVVFKRTPL